jgi:hypothetical protein
VPRGVARSGRIPVGQPDDFIVRKHGTACNARKSAAAWGLLGLMLEGCIENSLELLAHAAAIAPADRLSSTRTARRPSML